MSTVPGITRVHALEPSPDAFGELSANIAANGLGQTVIAHNKAASDAARTLSFGIVYGLSGANSVVDTSIHQADKFSQQIEVEGLRLDNLLGERGKVLAIKIDVEGHEREALDGMVELLGQNKFIMQIEDFSAADGGVAEVLKAYGAQMLFSVAADCYFTNIRPLPTDAEIVAIFQRATEKLVETNLAIHFAENGTKPIDLRLGRFLNIQLTGPTADLARKVRSALHGG
jgi:FkbM family methyltransferase